MCVEFERFKSEDKVNFTISDDFENAFTLKKGSVRRRKEITIGAVDYASELPLTAQAVANLKKHLAEEEAKKTLANSRRDDSKAKLKELEMTLCHLRSKKDILDKKCKELAANVSTSPADSNILQTWRRKFSLYKEITGIKWDFTCPDTNIRGYIRNKKAGTTHHFDLDGKPAESIWNLLKSASHADWADVSEPDNKENHNKGNSNEK